MRTYAFRIKRKLPEGALGMNEREFLLTLPAPIPPITVTLPKRGSSTEGQFLVHWCAGFTSKEEARAVGVRVKTAVMLAGVLLGLRRTRFTAVRSSSPEVTKVETAQIAPLDPFQRLPDAFVRIQLWGISWEALQRQPLGRPMRQEVLDEVPAMNGGAIPNDDQAARHFAPQVFQEGHHLCRVDGALLSVEVQLALRRDRTDGGEVIAGPPFPHQRGLADRRVGTDDAGQGIKARFIYKEERVLLGRRPFLMAGQVSARPRARAASSRCRARRAGFWGLHRRALHTRLIWPGW
jgi:hypothetical protein